MKKLIFAALAVMAIFAIAGCASSGGGGTAAAEAPVELPPQGTERVTLGNGGYVIYKFDLPAGAVWSDYEKVSVEYMVDEANIAKTIRSTGPRLMGVYTENRFQTAGRIRNASLNDDAGNNGPYILDNTARKFADMGASADQWFTVEYDISGTKGHTQFRQTNLPAPDAAGPFWFGVGIPSEDAGDRASITQLIRNVTLVSIDGTKNVVSTGSGFAEPTFAVWTSADGSRVSNF